MAATEHCPFRCGQKIICINDDFRAADHSLDQWERPKAGVIYTVRSLFIAEVIVFPYGEQVTVLLDEIRNPPVTGFIGNQHLDNVEIGFYWRRFIPLVEEEKTESESVECRTSIDCLYGLISEDV